MIRSGSGQTSIGGPSQSGRPNQPETVSADAVLAAAGLVQSYFMPMAQRAYGDAAVSKAERLGAALARHLVRAMPEVINARDLYKSKLVQGLTTAEEAEIAIQVAVEAGFLAPAPSRAGETEGRPRKDYRVNPRLREDHS
jgi:hypothetical protein